MEKIQGVALPEDIHWGSAKGPPSFASWNHHMSFGEWVCVSSAAESMAGCTGGFTAKFTYKPTFMIFFFALISICKYFFSY